MDLSSFQRKAIIFIIISIAAGGLLLARKEPLNRHYTEKTKRHLQDAQVASDKIDINTADLPLLIKLPGIGPGLAKQIIDYRNAHGPFKTLNDLQKVPGIGPKRTERIKDKITLEEGQPEGKTPSSSKINLNTASPEDLSVIIGIGPKLAQAIVNYREKYGPFQSLDELIQVPKIGPKTCETLKEYLYIDPESVQTKTPDNKEIIYTSKRTHEIDTSLSCRHCGKTLWEKGTRKKVYIRCPHCLKLLNEK